MQLLLAAVQHGCSNCIRGMARHLSAAGQLDAAQVAQLLQSAGASLQSNDNIACIDALYQLPAIRRLSADMVKGLLSSAHYLSVLNTYCAAQLLSLPAAGQLDSSDVVQLLQVANAQRHAVLVNRLCGLPAANMISCSAAADLLHTAVCQQDVACTRELSTLRSVRLFCAGQMSPLLEAAVTHKAYACLSELWRVILEHTLAVDPSVLVAAMKAALYTNHVLIACQLCSLNEARDMSTTHVADLLRHAAKAGSVVCTELLCKLPAAQHISCTDVADAMMAAAENGGAQCMVRLCRLPASKFLTWAQVERLLDVCMGVGSRDGVELLCQLPAAAGLGLDVAAVVQLWHAAKQQRGAGCERMQH
jgi:hypothetical protein